MRVNQLLFENELAKKRFEKRLRDFAEMVKTAKNNLRTDEDSQTLALADIVRILAEAKRHTDAAVVEKRKELAAAQKDVLTPERAELIAQNIFAGGAWKELRARENKYRCRSAAEKRGGRDALHRRIGRWRQRTQNAAGSGTHDCKGVHRSQVRGTHRTQHGQPHGRKLGAHVGDGQGRNPHRECKGKITPVMLTAGRNIL